jgi:hypothetical protein
MRLAPGRWGTRDEREISGNLASTIERDILALGRHGFVPGRRRV